MDAATLEREYNARASVPDFDAEYAEYVRLSHAAVARYSRIADIVYDERSGETLDIFPAGPDSPLFVWLHGGYWRALSKDDNAFVVDGLLPRGVSVAVVNYSLAPVVTLDEIIRQVRAALAWLFHHAGDYGIDPKRLHVGGSSAGGQLVGMLLAPGWTAPLGLPAHPIATATALSGLFDLEPLRHISQNEWLHLDAEAARRNSPLFSVPTGSLTRLLVAAGGQETAEFRRQSADYLRVWREAGNAGDEIALPGNNHFNIAVALATPGNVLNQAVLDGIGVRTA